VGDGYRGPPKGELSGCEGCSNKLHRGGETGLGD